MSTKKYINIFLILIFLTGNALAFELDESVDKEIRQKYNTSRLEQDALPDLPNILKGNDTNKKPDIP